MIFTDAALEAIALRAQGWLRILNSLNVSGLLYGANLENKVIDEEIVRHS